MRIFIVIILAALLLVNSLITTARECPKMVFFDIGQGDSFLITNSGNTTQLLIDGGKDFAVIDQLGKAMPSSDKTIELVIATHPDLDHIGGLVHVLKRFDVTRLLLTGAPVDKPVNQALYQAISPYTEVVYAHQGWRWEHDEIALEVIAPQSPYLGSLNHPDNVNDGSIAGIIELNGVSLLFTGDAEHGQERKLLESGVIRQADIMHAGHHGSKTSNSDQLLQAVAPVHFVIQSGYNNQYGHPHDEVISRVVEQDSTIWRTDLHGTTTFTICQPGTISSIKTERIL
jgi:competence protein ComEC